MGGNQIGVHGFGRRPGDETGRDPGIRFRIVPRAKPAIGGNHAGELAALQREARCLSSHRTRASDEDGSRAPFRGCRLEAPRISGPSKRSRTRGYSEGDATFNGIKFRLERGDITFANPVAIEPQVNLQATTHVRNYDLDVTVTGTPDRLNVNYRSEPPLPKSDIIALLALGRTSEESEQLQQQSGQTLFSDEATNLIINQAINSAVGNRMQKLFGVSRIKIDPQGLTTETNPTARGPQITIEQEFANNLSLSYSTNVAQSSEQIIQGEYYINRNVSVLGTRDQNGVVSFDVRVRRRKK